MKQLSTGVALGSTLWSLAGGAVAALALAAIAWPDRGAERIDAAKAAPSLRLAPPLHQDTDWSRVEVAPEAYGAPVAAYEGALQ